MGARRLLTYKTPSYSKVANIPCSPKQAATPCAGQTQYGPNPCDRDFRDNSQLFCRPVHLPKSLLLISLTVAPLASSRRWMPREGGRQIAPGLFIVIVVVADVRNGSIQVQRFDTDLWD
jgi:hypothetical protein